MYMTPSFEEGRLIKRYKRFLVDVEIGGEVHTVHCTNTGAMLGLLEEGNRVWVSTSLNPDRKLAKTLEIIEAEGVMVGANTHRPNGLVQEAIELGIIDSLQGYSRLQREVKYDTNSRIDLYLTSEGRLPCYVEVKNAHHKRGQTALFPDSVTSRGAKHMEALARLTSAGEARCMVVYVIQRNDVEHFSLAEEIDSVYAASARSAKVAGVEMVAYVCHVSPHKIVLEQQIPVVGV